MSREKERGTGDWARVPRHLRSRERGQLRGRESGRSGESAEKQAVCHTWARPAGSDAKGLTDTDRRTDGQMSEND